MLARFETALRRRGVLTPYAREAEAKTLELLESSLHPGAHGSVPEVVAGRRQSSMARDIEELLSHLEQRGQDAKAEADAKLKKRGDDEADSIRRVLDDQKRRVVLTCQSLTGRTNRARRVRTRNSGVFHEEMVLYFSSTTSPAFSKPWRAAIRRPLMSCFRWSIRNCGNWPRTK